MVECITVFVQRSRREPWTSILKCVSVCVSVTNFQATDRSKYGDIAELRDRSYDIARLLLMVPLETLAKFYPIIWCGSHLYNKN